MTYSLLTLLIKGFDKIPIYENKGSKRIHKGITC